MDSRPDEQLRGITMKSSAISIRFLNKDDNEEYLINVIDTPGHVDFSSEVSTAVRLCDGACVLIDVVEGVCPQTQAVLRQIWSEGIRPVLAINKMDRLIVELKFTTAEAYEHLKRLLEQVNAFMGELFGADVIDLANTQQEGDKNKELDDQHLYFSPEKNNVVFCSAVDGWGFRICEFAEIYANKMKVPKGALQKTLWGDYYLDAKSKRVKKGAYNLGKKTMFVQFILDSIWSIYNSVLVDKNKDKIEQICKALELRVSSRDMRSLDQRNHLIAIIGQWLPLSTAILGMVVEKLPGCKDMKPERVDKLLYSAVCDSKHLLQQTTDLKQAFQDCASGDDDPVIIYISKMLPVERKFLQKSEKVVLSSEEWAEKGRLARLRHAARQLAKENLAAEAGTASDQKASEQEGAKTEEKKEAEDENKVDEKEEEKEPEEKEDEEVFIAFARIFSGNLRSGQKLLVLTPKHDPFNALTMTDGRQHMKDLTSDDLANLKHAQVIEVGDLYMFMGMELEKLDVVPAGNVIGIAGLDKYILNSGTLTSTIACPSFTDMYFEANPILRVAIEPKIASDMEALEKGLRLLNQADACVQVSLERTGEHVIVAAGQVHLQKCVDDLTERFAKVEVNVSDPIVPFRETLVVPPITDAVNETIEEDLAETPAPGTAAGENQDTSNEAEQFVVEFKGHRYGITAVPLPEEICACVEAREKLLTSLTDKSERQGRLSTATLELRAAFEVELRDLFTSHDLEVAVDDIWSFGPRGFGANILTFCSEEMRSHNFWSEHSDQERVDLDLKKGIVSGFSLATESGPLCEEQMRGVCFVVKEILDTTPVEVDELSTIMEKVTIDTVQDKGRSYHGKLMSNTREMCRRAFQADDVCPRIAIAMYSCDVQATTEVLGKLYASLTKRGGRVISEEMTDGWSLFNVHAVIPMAESFGFAADIRKRTSGLASPQLKFSHWEVIPTDPFWVPTTEEEYLHFGEKADTDNLARKYMNSVRRRKGLKVNEHIVEFAEKQRNLSKNK